MHYVLDSRYCSPVTLAQHTPQLEMLLSSLAKCCVPVWAGKSVEGKDFVLRSDTKNSSYCVLQSVMNAEIEERLKQAGFQTQPSLRMEGSNRTIFPDACLSSKNQRVLVENQFAGMARVDSDVRKLSQALFSGIATFCVHVTPTRDLARLISPSCASFERTQEVFQEWAYHTQAVRNILLVGLVAQPEDFIDFKKSMIPYSSYLSGKSKKSLLRHVARELVKGTEISKIGLAPGVPLVEAEDYAIEGPDDWTGDGPNG